MWAQGEASGSGIGEFQVCLDLDGNRLTRTSVTVKRFLAQNASFHTHYTQSQAEFKRTLRFRLTRPRLGCAASGKRGWPAFRCTSRRIFVASLGHCMPSERLRKRDTGLDINCDCRLLARFPIQVRERSQRKLVGIHLMQL